MIWDYIIGEGLCCEGMEEDREVSCPRGLLACSEKCLFTDDDWDVCKHLGWADGTAAEVATYIPLRQLFADRFCYWRDILIEEFRLTARRLVNAVCRR